MKFPNLIEQTWIDVLAMYDYAPWPAMEMFIHARDKSEIKIHFQSWTYKAGPACSEEIGTGLPTLVRLLASRKHVVEKSQQSSELNQDDKDFLRSLRVKW